MVHLGNFMVKIYSLKWAHLKTLAHLLHLYAETHSDNLAKWLTIVSLGYFIVQI